MCIMEMKAALHENTAYAEEVEKLSSLELLVQAPVWTNLQKSSGSSGKCQGTFRAHWGTIQQGPEHPPKCWSRALDGLASGVHFSPSLWHQIGKRVEEKEAEEHHYYLLYIKWFCIFLEF